MKSYEAYKLTLDRLLLGLIAAALVCDVPAARAYLEHQAFTETLGRFLFQGGKELTGLPVPFTPFELLSYSLALFGLFLHSFPRSRLGQSLLLCALSLPLIGAYGFAIGGMRGHSLRLALTQLHFIPMIGTWLLLGSYVGTRPRLQGRVIRLLFWTSLWRATYAWYVYLFVFGGSLGEREYLIDHASSLFLALGMCYAGFQVLAQHRVRTRVCFYALSFLWILGPYVLNDRRASFAGVLVALGVLPWVLPPRMRLRLFPIYKRGVLGLGLILLVLVLRTNDINSLAGALRTEAIRTEELTYRHIENYDLMLGVIEQPFLGLGYGRYYPQVLALPDIAFAFPLFAAIPHNQVYYLWAFAGPLGIGALMMMSSGLWMLVVRCGRLALRPGQLLCALMGMVALSQWLMYVLFDMGLSESRSMMLVGIFAGSLFPNYARRVRDQWNVYHNAKTEQGSRA